MPGDGDKRHDDYAGTELCDQFITSDKIIVQPYWSSRSFSIGLLVGGFISAFIIVPLAVWLIGGYLIFN